MIIRSQNKEHIVNMDSIVLINVCEKSIYAHSEKRTFPLGDYENENKAIKVLDMIQNTYTQYATIKDGVGNVHGGFNIPKCFQMPQDSEV